ncbi:class I SAM-dependent methyltransferase [Nitrospira sp. Nam80]
MLLRKNPEVTGKEHYQTLYKNDLADQAEWLRRCAREKVDSIERLLKHNHISPRTILELGCGTGAVIMECQRRGLAEQYTAVDYSHEAIGHLRGVTSGINCIVADITAMRPLSLKCDVLILSHVIEHLEAPTKFLASVRNLQFLYLIAEVPLEDLLAGKVKAMFSDRTRNTAGHVQFFTAESFRRLLVSTGFVILNTRRYVPVLNLDTIRFVCKRNGWGLMRQMRMRMVSRCILPLLNPLWSKIYYAHYAALCRKQTADH